MQYEKLKPGYLLHIKPHGRVVEIVGDGPDPDTYRVVNYWGMDSKEDRPVYEARFDEFSGHYLGAP